MLLSQGYYWNSSLMEKYANELKERKGKDWHSPLAQTKQKPTFMAEEELLLRLEWLLQMSM